MKQDVYLVYSPKNPIGIGAALEFLVQCQGL